MSKKAMIRYKKIHAPGGIRIIRSEQLVESDIDDEEDVDEDNEDEHSFDQKILIAWLFISVFTLSGSIK